MNRERKTSRYKVQRVGYEEWWTRILRRGEAIAYIRPATKREAMHWLATHRPDAEHLTWFQIGVPEKTRPSVGEHEPTAVTTPTVVTMSGEPPHTLGPQTPAEMPGAQPYVPSAALYASDSPLRTLWRRIWGTLP